jgi:hypothetical protein
MYSRQPAWIPQSRGFRRYPLMIAGDLRGREAAQKRAQHLLDSPQPMRRMARRFFAQRKFGIVQT